MGGDAPWRSVVFRGPSQWWALKSPATRRVWLAVVRLRVLSGGWGGQYAPMRTIGLLRTVTTFCRGESGRH